MEHTNTNTNEGLLKRYRRYVAIGLVLGSLASIAASAYAEDPQPMNDAAAKDEVDINALRDEVSKIRTQQGGSDKKDLDTFGLSDDAELEEARSLLVQKEAQLLNALKSEQAFGKHDLIPGQNQKGSGAPKIITVKGSQGVDGDPSHQETAPENEMVPFSVKDLAPSAPESKASDIAADHAEESAYERTARAAAQSAIAPTLRKAASTEALASGSDGESRDLRKKVQYLQSKLDSTSVSINALRKVNGTLEDQVAKTKVRNGELQSEVQELRNRLILAETQVERLNNIIQARTNSTLSRMAPNTNWQNNGASLSRSSVTLPAAQPSARAEMSRNERVGDMQTAMVIADKANLRSGPNKESAPFMTVPRGTNLVIETRQGEWYRVYTPNGTRAWISAEVLEFKAEGDSSSKSTLRIKPYDSSL